MCHVTLVFVAVDFFRGGKGNDNERIKILCEHITCMDKSYRISRMRPSKFETSSCVSTPVSMVEAGLGGFGGFAERKITKIMTMLIKS